MTLNGDNARARARRGAARGLYMAAEHVLAESDRHVPHEEGTLSRSGKATVDESELRAAVTYDTPYAVTQHEDLTLAHDPGRTAKFLENAFNSQRATIGEIVATHVRRELGS